MYKGYSVYQPHKGIDCSAETRMLTPVCYSQLEGATQDEVGPSDDVYGGQALIASAFAQNDYPQRLYTEEARITQPWPF